MVENISSVMIDISHACTITFVQTFEFLTNIYICTIIIYSHSKFHNNWLKTCHQSWLTSFMHAQSHLCKHLSYLLIYIYLNIYYIVKFLISYQLVENMMASVMIDIIHACTITFVQTFEFLLIYIYICTIIIYSHSKFHNNWLKTWCHQSWLTSFMQTQSRLCKHLSFLY